jgi:nucleosome assembly protein 1-like 1
MSTIRPDQAVTDHTSTPQNTPLDKAPISSRAQQPGVSSIKEGMRDRLFASIITH